MAKKQYGFGIIGCGVIGKSHAARLQEIGEAKLIAVCDEIPERAQALAEKYGVAWYTDINEMVTREDIDIVNVCTPSGMHGDHTIVSARAGKHVISEKPIDITLEKAREMIAECRKAGVKLAVISQHRFQPSTQQVKRDIEAGKLGQLLIATGAINWYRSQEYYDSGEWRGTWELDGGGALMNQGVHTVDVLQYLMGSVDTVQAYCETLGHERIEVEDASVAIIRFKNGGIGTLLGTTCAYPGLSTRIEIFGKEGSAVIDADKLVHAKYRSEMGEVGSYGGSAAAASKANAGANASDPTAIPVGGHIIQMRDMIEAIEEDRDPAMSGEEAIKPLEIILAIYESSRNGGRPVKLPLKRG